MRSSYKTAKLAILQWSLLMFLLTLSLKLSFYSRLKRYFSRSAANKQICLSFPVTGESHVTFKSAIEIVLIEQSSVII